MKHSRWMVPLVLAGLAVPGVAHADTGSDEALTTRNVAVAADTPVSPNGEKDTDVPSPGTEDPVGPKDDGGDVPNPDPDTPSNPTPETPQEDPKETVPTPGTPEKDKPAVKPSTPGGNSTGSTGKAGSTSGSAASRASAGKAGVSTQARATRGGKRAVKTNAVASLPATGASTEALGAVAGVALLAGGGLVAASRKRGVRRPKHLKEA